MSQQRTATKMAFASPIFISSLSAFLLLTGCAGLPVRGTVGGQTIETRVDSEAARYYLASYLAGKHHDAALDERIDRVYESAQSNLPDRSELKRLSDDFSIDFAALYLFDRIARTPVNRSFRSAFEDALVYTRKAVSEGRVRLPDADADYEWLFVPTYLYKRYPITGADFAGPRAALQRCRGQPSYTLVVRQIMIVWAESTNELSGDQLAVEDTNTEKGNTMQIHYLEIVTPDVDVSVALYSKIHGISFGAADESLGGARTAKLANGGTLGIRAPLRDTETPVVRPYFLVHDIEAAVAAAGQSGAKIAMQPTEIPGRCKFAILIQGGIESGLWQV